MAKLNNDGVTLHYDYYPHTDKDAPVLLLSHGYSADSGMWRGQIAALNDHVHLLLWDMRGHGRSDYPDDPGAYSEAATVADMAALLDCVDAKSAIVGGLSLGGYMSLAFHARQQDRVSALMLFDTGPGFKKDAARDAWNVRAHERADALEARGLQALGDSREILAAQHRDATGLAGAARGMLAQRDDTVIQSLDSIKVPTLIVVGADDMPFLAATDYMANKIANSRKVVIPDAGHASNIDQPAAFNDAVMAFLVTLA